MTIFLKATMAGVLSRALRRLPEFRGERIRVHFRPKLRVVDGRLVSGGQRGHEIHAGCHLRARYVVLDADLLASPLELRRILLHELFHFVWARLANPLRASWELILLREIAAGARGELGWSAEWRKARLEARDIRQRSRRWRDYVCESFCDTAAAFLCGKRHHEEFTLAQRFRQRRQRWLESFLATTHPIPV